MCVDLDKLRQGGLKPTQGDTRCIIFGHLVRMTVWNLRKAWQPALTATQKLETVARHLATLPQLGGIEAMLFAEDLPALRYAVNEGQAPYENGADEISF